jgi:cell division protein FtsB
MNEERTFEQLRKENDQLRHENELLKAKVNDVDLLKAKITNLKPD